MQISVYANVFFEPLKALGDIMVIIKNVEPNSKANSVGILPEDVLVSINGNEINDVLDYRFYLVEKKVTLLLCRGNEKLEKIILKREYDDIGLEFATPLMDEKHSCRNKCIFCFIDQLPKGMRETLYFKDDDSRLSFLHGNYITLTNLYEKDIDRIIKMHISPMNISVHTTNPVLRCKMMNNRRAGEVLSYLDNLAGAGIELCVQIVLCRGVNDGDELLRTMKDLLKYVPSLKSVSIVPAGLTDFREGLYPLEPYSSDECAEIIDTVQEFSDMCLEKYGTRIFFCADEFYLKAELSLPNDEYYEDYSQIENGVGLLTSFEAAVKYDIDEKNADMTMPKRSVSIATGSAAYNSILSLASTIEEKFKGIKISVYKVSNDYFGKNITVAGLLTGKDIYEQLKERPLGDELLISSSCLRAQGDLFLCGMSISELSEKLRVPIRTCSPDGSDFLCAVLGENMQ